MALKVHLDVYKLLHQACDYLLNIRSSESLVSRCVTQHSLLVWARDGDSLRIAAAAHCAALPVYLEAELRAQSLHDSWFMPEGGARWSWREHDHTVIRSRCRVHSMIAATFFD